MADTPKRQHPTLRNVTNPSHRPLHSQLIEKNVQLTDELDKHRSRSEYELTSVHAAALKEKGRADAVQRSLTDLRHYVSDYLSLPSEPDRRNQSEQEFWESIATPDVLRKSSVPAWHDSEGYGPPSKIVLPLFSGEADNFRAAYQRLAIENTSLKDEVSRLKRTAESRRPMIQKVRERQFQSEGARNAFNRN